ncbi:ornithine cyclodeaminase [Trinickia terrae]|uniref:Ornithine cyclodeaminase n=1 Tax=Trinickia terrae TaxID=2571161 RepID=A0A4U1I3X3_9BURK|nr:ornithine cyclodeaminase [Trinickia terrae]TKC87958.1 ornithine cyclodeaminase [Trinickia terrae]
MTRFLDVPATSRLVARIGVARFLGELVDTLRADYLRWGDFDKSPRVACHSRDGVIELMPVADAQLFAFKYVNGHPVNAERGIHTVMAFGALAEVGTGYPLLLAELTLTTALRTAATSVLAAKALARPGSRKMALIGNGAQSEFQAIAFHTLLGIDEIRVFDVDARATGKLVRNLSAYPALEVVRAASTADAVRDADIVTTVTADKAYATILTPDMIEPGMHLNAVGGDCPGKTELHADVLRMSRVFVEYEPQTRIEGDIQQLPADFPVVELWRVLQGEAAGREHAAQVTTFDSVGFALEDYSALRYLYALALEHEAGIEIALIPPAAEPKNLFALIGASGSHAAPAATPASEPAEAFAFDR